MYHPSYTCQRITRAIDLTGRLDDPLWQQAAVAELTNPATGDLTTQGATARLLYSDDYLYIGFACTDDYIYATFTEHDASVWEEGCFETFLCPSGKVRQYYELNVSPLNTVFDTFILNGRQAGVPGWQINSFTDFTCAGMLTKTHVNGTINTPGAQGWSAEYAIPFSSLIGNDHLVPEPGDEWRMNLCHIASAKPGADRPHFSWATIGSTDFHACWTFGTLRFA